MFKVGDVVRELTGFKSTKNDIKIGDLGVIIEVIVRRNGNSGRVKIRYFDGQTMYTNESFYNCLQLVKSNEQF